MTTSINAAIKNFEKNNSGKEFYISINEEYRKYPNGMYCHCIIIYWDKFFDKVCGNGKMWGQDKYIFFDNDEKQIISENFTNNTHAIKDFTSFNLGDKTVTEILNNMIL
ncbi:MAG: hypothetical protein WCJ61_01765 [Paludibacter sp.]